MLEECSLDIAYFARTRSWKELRLMGAVFLAITLHSMALGVVIGLLLVSLSMIRTSSKLRIKVSTEHEEPRTLDCAERRPYLLAQVLESVTFTNYNELIHFIDGAYESESGPGLVVVDLSGVTDVDSCAAHEITMAISRRALRGLQSIIKAPAQERLAQRLSSLGMKLDQVIAASM